MGEEKADKVLISDYTHNQQAGLQYLLTTKELDAIPSVTCSFGAMARPMFCPGALVARVHAEQLATQRYPDGLVGLERDREARKTKAKEGRAQVLANYEKRKVEALKASGWVGG